MCKEEELALDFEKGVVLRGKEELFTLNELLFLLESAVKYNDMFPIEESREFVAKLRENIGVGFTREQFKEFTEQVKAFYSEEEE